MPSTVRVTLVVVAALVLASCRLVIHTDDTGSISSVSGRYDCAEGTCAFDIPVETTASFTAVPAPGYRFVRWRGMCLTSPTAQCTMTLGPLPAEHRAREGDIELWADFEPEGSERRWYRDRDGDHFGDADDSRLATSPPAGFVVSDRDCDDSDPEVRPWTRERADGIDNNCNGKVDEGFTELRFYLDADGDGFGDPDTSELSTRRPEGYADNDLDCNDASAAIYPGADELADGMDNDCDDEIDEGGTLYFRDVDGDGYGTAANTLQSLEPMAGYVTVDGDCDDNNPDVAPNAEELFDSVDNDCDGEVDEGFTTRTYYRDADRDGYGDPADSTVDVELPSGYVSNDWDNCPATYNPSQTDTDGDGLGDACDAQNDLDLDNDSVLDSVDNCPGTYNPSQADTDGDGQGDACDTIDNGGGGGGCSPSPQDQAMLDAVNAFRAGTRSCGANGTYDPAPALAWSCELANAARNHSIDMATNDFFSHTGSDGSSAGDRATRAGFSWSAWGENIAAGYSSVNAVMQGWIDSPGHCANLMAPMFTHLGAARYDAPGSTWGVYWTQAFARAR